MGNEEEKINSINSLESYEKKKSISLFEQVDDYYYLNVFE
jgi:hypothetical protein